MRYAVIGNIEGSKTITSMNDVMKKLKSVLEEVNKNYKSEFITPFELTIGDEFQALFKSAEHLIETIYKIRYKMFPINIRFGIGVDEKGTGDKHGAAGKVWFRARDAVMYLKLEGKKKKLKVQAPIILNTSDNPVKDLVNETLNSLYFIESSWGEDDFQFIRILVHSEGFTQKPSVDNLLPLTELKPQELKAKIKNLGYLDITALINKIDSVINTYNWRE